MKFLFSTQALLVISWAFLVLGLAGMILSQLRLVGEGEPLFVLQLSWLAITATGYGNIVSALINKKVEKK